MKRAYDAEPKHSLDSRGGGRSSLSRDVLMTLVECITLVALFYLMVVIAWSVQ